MGTGATKPMGGAMELTAGSRREQHRVMRMIDGEPARTATALRLARFFGTGSKFRLGLQEDLDLDEVPAQEAARARFERAARSRRDHDMKAHDA
jgi:plasmid maintenance system antidote protein VapI